MSECPAYLGVKVTRRSLRWSVEMVHYDLLILCPVHFNLSLTIIDHNHRDQQQQQQQPVTSYDVTLTDSQQRSFHSFHTHVGFLYICGQYFFYLNNKVGLFDRPRIRRNASER